VIEQVDVEIGADQLVLDELPDDARHLVAVDLHDGLGNLDLRHRKNLAVSGRERLGSRRFLTAPRGCAKPALKAPRRSDQQVRRSRSYSASARAASAAPGWTISARQRASGGEPQVRARSRHETQR